MNLKLIIFISIFILINSSLKSEYVDNASWNKNALLQINQPSTHQDCDKGINSHIYGSAESIINTSVKINEDFTDTNPSFKFSCASKKEKNFVVKTIYMQKVGIDSLKKYYSYLKEKGLDEGAESFQELVSGYDKNEIYQCFISWIPEKEPKYYVGIIPCKK